MSQTARLASSSSPIADGEAADPRVQRPAMRGSQIGVVGGVTVAVAVLDQMAKNAALSRLSVGVPVPIVEGLAAFTLVLNPGLAFGFLRALGPEHWWLMTVLALGALGLLLHLASTILPHSGRGLSAIFGLILGGASGNIVDRIRLGGVVDFIDLSWGPYHWPAFNTADAALSVGVAILMGHAILRESSKAGRGPQKPPMPEKELSR